MAKTIAIGGKNYKAGSKRANEAIAAGGRVSSKSSDIRSNADASKARTSARGGNDYMGNPLDSYTQQEDRNALAEKEAFQAGTAPGLTPPTVTPSGIQPPSPQVPSLVPPGGAEAPVQTPAATPTPTQSKYQQALSTLNAQGPAPADLGQARAIAASATPAAANTSIADNLYAEVPELQQIADFAKEYYSPDNLKGSLMDDYKKYSKQLGISEINEEIIDAETILDGTEDDIRTEIQQAGGFGTESQVQAMTLARNKGLLKRYNQLVSLREQNMNQLNMMVNLSAQDRQIAQQRFDSQLNIMFKGADYRMQFQRAAENRYQWLAQTMGADGLYDSLKSDPNQLRYAETILGTGAGGLAKVAETARQQRSLETTAKLASIEASRASTAASYATIAEKKAAAATDAAKAQQKVDLRVTKAKTVLGKVDEALALSNNQSTGLLGGISRGLPGSAAYNLDKTVQTIKANIGFDELQAMREASPTGGALGQVAVQELEGLQSTIASLDIGQDRAQLEANLQQVEDRYLGWIAAAAPERLEEMGYVRAPDGQFIKIIN